jgi:hypothetical protein
VIERKREKVEKVGGELILLVLVKSLLQIISQHSLVMALKNIYVDD